MRVLTFIPGDASFKNIETGEKWMNIQEFWDAVLKHGSLTVE